jgi:uncharacterized sulfatase
MIHRISLVAAAVFVFGCILTTPAARAAGAAAPTTRPNVLFIICDDLNTTSLGCYGNTVCKTPNIDRLASMGVKFDRAYCQWPLCWPSRNSFLSGRRPDWKTPTNPYRQAVPDVDYFPQRFRESGYFTGRVGKIFHTRTIFTGAKDWEDPACWDLSEKGGTKTDPGGYAVWFADKDPRSLAAHPEVADIVEDHELLNQAGHPAYDYWMDKAELKVPDSECTDGVISARISELLDQRSHAKDGKPFFLAAGFRRPHLLWVVPRKYFDMYPPEKIQLPDNPANDLDDIPKVALTRGAPDMTDLQRKKAIGAYYACVSEVDDNVGKLLETMDRLKLWDNTIVVFTSDHGWHLDEHGLWGKVSLFRESARVPLIIVAPGVTHPGGVSPRMVEMLDYYPTLCELAGIKPPKEIDGMSIVPQLKDPQAPRAKPAFTVVRKGKIWGKSVQTERYRYTEWGDNASKGVELYDHQSDPKEYTNLAHDPAHAGIIKQLKPLLDKQIHVHDKDPLPKGGTT